VFVSACVREGIPVCPIPGASALAALISIAGFSESAFVFYGFFPREEKERVKWAKKAGGLSVFYESPHRIRSTLAFLAETFPEAPLVVGRELTKRFETVSRGSALDVAAEHKNEEPRGEYVCALLLPVHEEKGGLSEGQIHELVKELAELGASQKVLLKAAMSHGMRKNEAYKLSLEFLEKRS
jgi:16S rRNA (cytidine1402-2'-O)-methyltransferase